MKLTDITCVVPSCLRVNEEFTLKVKLLGPIHPVKSLGAWNTVKPGLGSPFNLNVQRQIQFMDNVLPEWQSPLRVQAPCLEGPSEIQFHQDACGVYPGDTRPVGSFSGFRWTQPGFHFLTVTDPVSGTIGLANPTFVCADEPAKRLFWGDPHWQTYFSDGIRCPEELYTFARDEGFLDFGAISDHMEAVTNRQWEYFQAVTNDFNEPGRFATLQGQEWTHHNSDHGAPGHRNVYYRGDGGPVLRSTDLSCNTLEKLWRNLEIFGKDALAIPHHSANQVMGVDWSKGWNPDFEKAVEVYSVWGNSERSAASGNPRPINSENLGGEKEGRHIQDALAKGYRFGFVGGSDCHDGRPGDTLHPHSYPPRNYRPYDQGLTAVWTSALSRENVYDAMHDRNTYASTLSRIYLDVQSEGEGHERDLHICAASEEGIRNITVVCNGADVHVRKPEEDPRVFVDRLSVTFKAPGDYCYVRVATQKDNLAWSSPIWGET